MIWNTDANHQENAHEARRAATHADTSVTAQRWCHASVIRKSVGMQWKNRCRKEHDQQVNSISSGKMQFKQHLEEEKG